MQIASVVVHKTAIFHVHNDVYMIHTPRKTLSHSLLLFFHYPGRIVYIYPRECPPLNGYEERFMRLTNRIKRPS